MNSIKAMLKRLTDEPELLEITVPVADLNVTVRMLQSITDGVTVHSASWSIDFGDHWPRTGYATSATRDGLIEHLREALKEMMT